MPPSLKCITRAKRVAVRASSGHHHALPLSKRQVLIAAPLVLLGLSLPNQARSVTIQELEAEAYDAYSNREFSQAIESLTKIINMGSENEDLARLLELRANVLVDTKEFQAAIQDYDLAIKINEPPPSDIPDALQLESLARLYAGRALALEGLSEWEKALQDYSTAMDRASERGFTPDAYIINSIGNCYASLQRWSDAREAYLSSSQLFQQAKGFRGRGGSTTDRLDGAIFSASNAAVMLVQMGREEEAIKEMERIARRAPGSVDMRAALAALYYSKGSLDRAEDEFEWACTKIVTGCSKYRDQKWLSEVRRWPPVMVEKMKAFVSLK